MKNVVRVVGAILCLTLLATAAWAADQTGSLKGAVLGPDGKPLAGVTVKIVGESLLGEREIVTEANGEYRFIALPPGEYDVIATGAGYLGQVLKTQVRLARTTTVDFNLTVPEAEGQEIVVKEAKPTIDVEQTGGGEVIDEKFLRKIPVGRSYQSTALLVPGVVGGANPNIRGASSSENSFMVDGVNTSDPVTNTFSSNFNYDAIQELEVLTEAIGGANQGLGGVINIVTKSGGNDFEGSVGWHLQDDGLSPAPKLKHECAEYREGYVETGNDLEDQANCVDLILPSEHGSRNIFQDVDLTLGGPVIKDKMWFFVSYQFDQGVSENNGVPAPRVYTGHYGLGKLTYQVNPEHKLTLQLQSDPTTIARFRQSRFVPVVAEALQTQGGYFAQLKHEWFLSNDLLLETQVYQKNDYLDVTPIPDDGEIDFLTPAVLGLDGAHADANYGLFSFNRRTRNAGRVQVTHYRDGLVGSHQFMSGVDVSTLYERIAVGIPGNSRTYFNCSPALTCEGAGGGVEGHYYDVEYTGALDTTTSAVMGGFWLEDKWKPISPLVVQPVLRFDKGVFYNDDKDAVLDYFAVSPRLGATYDPFSDGRTVLRAGYGRFVEPGNLSLSDFMNAHDIGLKLFYDTDGDRATLNPLYLADQGESTTVRAPNVFVPRTDALWAAVERDVYRGLTVGITYAGRWSRYLFEDDESNVIWNADGNNIVGTRIGVADNRYRIRTPEDAVRYYQGMDFKVEKRFSDIFSLLAAYTLSETTGTTEDSYTEAFDNSALRRYDFGYLSSDMRHVVKIEGAYDLPIGLTLGGRLSGNSGAPYDRYFYNAFSDGYSDLGAARGTGGRLPSTYRADVKFLYTHRLPGRLGEVGSSLEVFNLTNNRQVVAYNGDQLNLYDRLRAADRMNRMSLQLGLEYRFF